MSRQRANAVLLIDYSRLETLAQTFILNHELDDFSECLVVMYPRPYSRRLDDWSTGREVAFTRLQRLLSNLAVHPVTAALHNL